MADYDQQIKQAELNKLIAETEKSAAEKKKLDLETEQLEKPLYKRLNFLKTMVAGFVGGLAILTVFKTVIEPLYKKDIIEAELKVAERKKENFELNDSIQSAKKSIKSAEKSILQLKKQNNEILDDIKNKEAKNLELLDSIKGYEEKLKQREKNIILQKRKTIEIINDQLKYLRSLNRVNAIHVQSIYFEYDKASLRESDKEQLQAVIKFLNENKTDNFKLLVEGYSYVKGSEAYNMKLSQRRANVVGRYLSEQGISRERIHEKGFGEIDVHELIVDKLDTETEKKLYELKSVVHVYLTY